MKRILLTLTVLALTAVSAISTPSLGWWERGHPRATYQSWDFDDPDKMVFEGPPDWKFGPDEVANSHPQSVEAKITADSLDNGVFYSDSHIKVFFEIGNFDDQLAYKEIWIDFGGTGFGTPIVDNVTAHAGDIAVYSWYVLDGQGDADVGIKILPNPKTEKLWITLPICDSVATLDYIVVDTICTSEENDILLTAPNGGEVLTAGDTYQITWSSTGSISDVLIEYSADNGETWNEIDTVCNTGSYDWTVPEVDSTECLVRISDASDSTINDRSDGSFCIFVLAAGTVKMYDSYGSGPGGEFQAEPSGWSFTPTSLDASSGRFETFCVEVDEHIRIGNTYYVKFSDSAIYGGAGGQEPPGSNSDPLDPRTAYLYDQFITGSLNDYNYEDDPSWAYTREYSADALQNAIWFIEEEITSLPSGLATDFYNEADNSGWSDIGYVRVMNMYLDENFSEAQSEDQLVRINVSGDMPVKGIDVSHHQGDINWSDVYNDGYRFAFIRATMGGVNTDDCFLTNMQGADANDILVGSYHFAYPQAFPAESEADNFFNFSKKYLKKGYLRPALDIENDECWNSYPYQLGAQGLSNWIREWMNTVKILARVKLGTEVEPILYLNRYYAGWRPIGDSTEPYLEDWVAEKYDLWIAHPTCEPVGQPSTGMWKDYAFWQYYIPEVCGDNSQGKPNSVPGINSWVDLNVFNGTTRDLNNMKIKSSIKSISFITKGQVDLNIIDPLGYQINPLSNAISDALYLEYDLDADGLINDIVSIASKVVGTYLIEVTPEQGNILNNSIQNMAESAEPNDTYSLETHVEGQTMVLAENVQIQDIPNRPYIFESKLNRCDFDTDGAVDFLDYAAFSSQWKETYCNYPGWCEGRDLNYDHVVDFNDLMLFQNNWLWETVTGDFNIDGYVEFKDLSIFGSTWLTESGQSEYNPECDISIPDDSKIDWNDLEIFADNWLECVDY